MDRDTGKIGSAWGQNTYSPSVRQAALVKATKGTEAGKMPEDQEKQLATMATYHEELAKAGVLLAASILQPSSQRWRIKYSGSKRTVIDGPFTEAKELITGNTMIHVKSREEPLEWTKRFPNPIGDGAEAEIEVRQLFELHDFGPSEAVESKPAKDYEAQMGNSDEFVRRAFESLWAYLSPDA